MFVFVFVFLYLVRECESLFAFQRAIFVVHIIVAPRHYSKHTHDVTRVIVCGVRGESKKNLIAIVLPLGQLLGLSPRSSRLDVHLVRSLLILHSTTLELSRILLDGRVARRARSVLLKTIKQRGFGSFILIPELLLKLLA